MNRVVKFVLFLHFYTLPKLKCTDRYCMIVNKDHVYVKKKIFTSDLFVQFVIASRNCP